MEVLDHGIQIETLELRSVVELLTHRIRQRGLLMQNPQIQLIRPPAFVRRRPGDRMLQGAVRKRALGFAVLIRST